MLNLLKKQLRFRELIWQSLRMKTLFLFTAPGIAVKPGLFIFIKHVEETLGKPDNDRLKDMADAAFTFGGYKHDFDPGRIMIEDNCWKIKKLS